jgi:Skp family chaperone for outer membrane proteins
MTKILRYFIFALSIFFSNLALSEESISYIDMDFIMNNSLAGKSIIKQLEKKNETLKTSFEKIENNFLKEEKKLISQKNILKKEDFDDKVSLFNKKVNEYKNKRSDTLNKYAAEKNKARTDLINELMPILKDYSSEKSISFILPKQSIILGKSELDITKDIIDVLNKKIKSIKLD